MTDQGTATSTTNTEGIDIDNAFYSDDENLFFCLEQNVLPTTKDSQTSASQQISVVDDATLQAVLSSMSETEMNAFLEELNKTGKACKKTKKKN